jgi:flagellar protein FlaI
MAYLDEMLAEAKKAEAKKAAAPAKPPAKPKKEEAKPKEQKPAVPAAEEEAGEAGRALVTAYGQVNIYKVEGQPLLLYSVPVVKPVGPERTIINTIKEAATRLITITPEEMPDPEARREFYFKRIKEIISSSPELGVPATKIDFYSDMVMREMIGYGILDGLVKDDQLEEVMVLSSNRPVYVAHRKYEMMKTNILFGSDEEIMNIISRIARDVNRRVDTQNPLLDARLPDGSRVNATIRPVSLEGATLTIRKFREDPLTIIDLIKFGTISSELAAFMWLAVDGMGAKPANILVSGGTGSGKTSTLNALSSFIPPRERIITMEDTAELRLPIEHWIRFETRPPGLEGTGEITMDMLVKNSLRMRPDRIILGEIRHVEAFTLFSAMNTGHDGCMGTVHANSAQETLVRLMNPPMNVPDIMVGALDFILVQQRIYDRRKGTMRRVTELAEVEAVLGGTPQVQVLYEWDPATDSFRSSGVPSKYLQKLQHFAAISKSELQTEMSKRKELLEKLADRGARALPDVVAELRRFQSK